MIDNASKRCPYQGLDPYTEQDREYFFGRERDQEIIASNLSVAPLTILYGTSGVGKSSVLQAGAIPQLRENRRVIVVLFSKWQGDGFQNALKQQVLEAVCQHAGKTASEVLNEVGNALDLKTTAMMEKLTLDDLLLGCAKAFRRRILLIFDQFEEYFLYHSSTTGTDGFDAQFARAVNQPDSGVNFMLSMREEELSKLDRFRPRIPTLLSNLLRLDNLDRDAAERAIREPLKVYNRNYPGEQMSVEDSLVIAVIDQVRPGHFVDDKTQLRSSGEAIRLESSGRIETPFLQLVLTRLWETEKEKGSSTLRLKTFTELGGATQIARTHLDDVMAQLTDSERAAAASILRFLVTPKGSKIALDPATLAGFANLKEEAVQSVLNRLSFERKMRILRKVTIPRQPSRYELFHDVLGPAILEWRARYMQEQQIVQERAQAEERFSQERARRVKQVAFVLAALLIIMAGLTALALAQTARANRERAEAIRLTKVANEALEKANQAQEQLQEEKKKVEQERDNTKDKARLLEISEANARESEQKALKAKEVAVAETRRANKARADLIVATRKQTEAEQREKELLQNSLSIVQYTLGGFDANSLGQPAAAINSFSKARELSENYPDYESYLTFQIAETHAATGKVIPLRGNGLEDAEELLNDPDLTSVERQKRYLNQFNKLSDLAKLEASQKSAVAAYQESITISNTVPTISSQQRRALDLQRIGDVRFSSYYLLKKLDDLKEAMSFYAQASDGYAKTGARSSEAMLQNRLADLISDSDEAKNSLGDANKSADMIKKIGIFHDKATAAYLEDKNLSGQAATLIRLAKLHFKFAQNQPSRIATGLDYYVQAAKVYRDLQWDQKAGDTLMTVGSACPWSNNRCEATTIYDQARESYQAARKTSNEDAVRTRVMLKEVQAFNSALNSIKSGDDTQKALAYAENIAKAYEQDALGLPQILGAIGDYFGRSNLESNKLKAIGYYEKEIQAWKTTGDKIELGNSYINLARTYRDLHDRTRSVAALESAHVSYNEVPAALLVDEKQKVRDQLISGLSTIGLLYGEQGERAAAFDSYKSALLSFATKPEGTFLSSDYRLSQIVSGGRKALFELAREKSVSPQLEEQAVEFFKTSREQYKKVHDATLEADVLDAAGNFYNEVSRGEPGKVDNEKRQAAVNYYEEARSLFQKTVYEAGRQYEMLEKIRKLYTDAPVQEKSATDYFQRMVDEYQKANNTRGEAIAHAALGSVYNSTAVNNKQEARKSYERARATWIKVNDVHNQVNVLRILSTIYKELGLTKEAADALIEADTLERNKATKN